MISLRVTLIISDELGITFFSNRGDWTMYLVFPKTIIETTTSWGRHVYQTS